MTSSDGDPRTVLVTGGCGFIGSHAVDALLASGRRVIVIDDLSTGSIANLHEEAVLCEGDVADSRFVDAVFAEHRPAVVLHEAAKINWGIHTENPIHDVTTSVIGTLTLAAACLKHEARLVYASSVAVYGRPPRLPVVESDPLRPIYSYGVAKRCAEEYLEFLGGTRGLRYAILRYANVYGPRQSSYGEVGVVSIFASAIARGERVVVFGNGEHVRDYVYVADAVALTMVAIEREDSVVINVGCGAGATTNDVLASFRRAAGAEVHVAMRPERDGELGRLYLDIGRARQLGWAPRVGLDEGIATTLAHARTLMAVTHPVA